MFMGVKLANWETSSEGGHHSRMRAEAVFIRHFVASEWPRFDKIETEQSTAFVVGIQRYDGGCVAESGAFDTFCIRARLRLRARHAMEVAPYFAIVKLTNERKTCHYTLLPHLSTGRKHIDRLLKYANIKAS